ncbi:MAG TPA: hypothetical protein DET40_25450 [Lentisphaeria bacterium]|nr:MAG: hypothetical protein A2X45_18515 [Lentisphaerae bacterium GWF2_50_93]HCE46907.1 hypothetical protein [Lentisphaeria bacterium]
MFFVVSGEGSSDLGTKDLDGSLKKGAMTFILDRLSELSCGQVPDYELQSESDVKQLRKLLNLRDTGPRGTDESKKESEKLWLNSYALAVYAKRKEERAGLVYFRDTDGTRAAPHDRWKRMVDAMYSGFKHADYKWGVAMVPRPKSEAWFLAYYQKNDGTHNAYDKCSRFEDMSGNDGSQNSCKSLLMRWCSCSGNVYQDVITEEEIKCIDWNHIDMPSLTIFRKRFENVITGLNGRSYPHPDCQYTRAS